LTKTGESQTEGWKLGFFAQLPSCPAWYDGSHLQYRIIPRKGGNRLRGNDFMRCSWVCFERSEERQQGITRSEALPCPHGANFSAAHRKRWSLLGAYPSWCREVARVSRYGPSGLRRNRAITPVRTKVCSSLGFACSARVVWNRRRLARPAHGKEGKPQYVELAGSQLLQR
jgi:hypothetical protein